MPLYQPLYRTLGFPRAHWGIESPRPLMQSQLGLLRRARGPLPQLAEAELPKGCGFLSPGPTLQAQKGTPCVSQEPGESKGGGRFI